MKKETYLFITQPFRDNPEMAKGIHIVNRVCTGMMYLAYPVLLCCLFYSKTSNSTYHFYKALLVPAIGFLLLSIFRHIINRPRPYETFQVPPAIKKETKGHSFPSRHVFSATMIAMSYLVYFPWNWVGILFLLVAILLGAVRVLSGVHYVSDVVVGMLVAIAMAVVGYYVI